MIPNKLYLLALNLEEVVDHCCNISLCQGNIIPNTVWDLLKGDSIPASEDLWPGSKWTWSSHSMRFPRIIDVTLRGPNVLKSTFFQVKSFVREYVNLRMSKPSKQ